MWGGARENLIATHRFYVAQARSRLLGQFNDATLEADAQRHADEWLERRGRFFDPDRDDPAADYERAHDEQISFHLSLAALRDDVRFSIIAGMFHQWEKEVRSWVDRELQQLFRGPAVRHAVWTAKFKDLINLFEACSWGTRAQCFYEHLHRCHLVVNVYKHGNGPSFEELRREAPDLIRGQELPGFFASALDYSSVRVSDDDLGVFAEAITGFWRAVPENTMLSQVTETPKWLEKALSKEAPA